MNSAAKYVINKHFSSDEVSFGIGIDTGKMLVTKTGIRKNGNEQHNYKNLVWLGKPANVASKLTDKANKPAQFFDAVRLHVIYERQNLFTGKSDWKGQMEWPHNFVKNLTGAGYPTYVLRHNDPDFRAIHLWETQEEKAPPAPAILMTEPVWSGFKAACPDDNAVTKSLIKPVKVEIAGITRPIYGGNVIFEAFLD